jgi:hypothetical protein
MDTLSPEVRKAWTDAAGAREVDRIENENAPEYVRRELVSHAAAILDQLGFGYTARRLRTANR